MKWLTRWKHRRMIRKAWSFWYMEQGSPAREMWRWRRENMGPRYASVVESMDRFGEAFHRFITGKAS